jgi:hypothetical protein
MQCEYYNKLSNYQPALNIPGEIMALSWKQPFAQLMLHGKIETRTWSTNYRGLVLICASKDPYRLNEVSKIAGDQLYNIERTLITNFKFLPIGKAIAVGRLIDCRKMIPEDEEKCYVKFRPEWEEKKLNKQTGQIKVTKRNLWCHIYSDVKPIEQFEWNGVQGWKALTQEQIDKIKFVTPCLAPKINCQYRNEK